MSEALDLFLSTKREVPDISYTLPGSGETILMRPFTTKEQKSILKAIEKEDHILLGEAFDQLLRNCVLTPNFNPEKLIGKDRECLLIKLRQESVKEEFIHQWRCPNCQSTNTYKTDLCKLQFSNIINRATLENKELSLRDRPITLILGLANRGDEKQIYIYAKKNSSNIKEISQAEIITAAYAAVIKGIKIEKERTIKGADGNDKVISETVTLDIPFADRVKILEEISIDDKNELKKYIESIDSYGYELSLGTLKCSKCSTESEETLEWLSFFMV